MILNFALTIMWLVLCFVNATVIYLDGSTLFPQLLVCTIDIVFARADFGQFYCHAVKNSNKTIYDKQMNNYAILSAIGAVVYIDLTAYKLYNQEVSVFFIICAVTLFVLSFFLTAKARDKELLE